MGIQERIVKVPKVEQIVTDTVVQNQVQTIEMEKPKIIQKTVQRKKPIIQEHITPVTKHVDVPQVQYVDKVVPVPVQKQRQVPMIQTVQKTVQVPQVQYIDKIVDVPVVKQRQVPMIQKVQRTEEVPQVQYVDRVVDVPVVKQRQV